MHILELMKCGIQVLAIILLFSPKNISGMLFCVGTKRLSFLKNGYIVIHCVDEPSIPVSFKLPVYCCYKRYRNE